MTRKLIFIATFFALLFAYPTTGMAKSNQENNEMIATKSPGAKAALPAGSNHGHAGSHEPGTKSQMPDEGHHNKAPKLDETAHIHRFHKERVKKVSKHHTKLWYLSKLLLVICHISLLIIGFMHIIH